jgi:hypothetical protein
VLAARLNLSAIMKKTILALVIALTAVHDGCLPAPSPEGSPPKANTAAARS